MGIKYFTSVLIALLLSGPVFTQKVALQVDSLPAALLLIDIQDFYFPGGKLPLVNPEAAAQKASEVLKLFRSLELPVIHVQHAGGSPIHASLQPRVGEKIFTKQEANAFVGTGLQDYLKSIRVKRLVLCGMQTHMCLEAATRAAADLGYDCIVVQDACATRDLKWGDRLVSAADVHASTLASIERFYGRVVNAEDLRP